MTSPLLKAFWRWFWMLTCKNSNFVRFGGFPRQGCDANAKMLPTVTFAF